MKFKAVFISAGILLLTAFAFLLPQEVDYSEKESVILQSVKQFIKQLHYAPMEFDDHYSRTVYKDYINRLDAGRRILTKEDLDKLSTYENSLDDEIRTNSFEFFDFSLKIWRDQLGKSKEIFEKVISEVPKFEEDEALEMNAEDRPFAENDKQLKDYWCKYIKYDILNRVDNLKEKQVNLEDLLKDKEAHYTREDSLGNTLIEEEKYEKDRKFVNLPMDSLILRAHEKTKENFKKWFQRMEDMRRVDWMTQYMNSITNVLDPHTGYFKPKDKEDFDLRMSNQLEGIGARLSKDGEYVKIVSLVPGGPAWKSGKLEEDDVILRVSQKDEEPVDIMGMHLDDVVSMIRGDKGSEVTLTVKHVGGEIENITLIRDVIVFEENYVKSAMLMDSLSGSQFGYIRLPSFYANFQDPTARSSGEDMKEELEKMTAQNAEGVILDLRNNGGGSLRDVVEIAGHFIEEGPVVQVKARKRKSRALDDSDPNVAFRGAVVVLVNHFSASASEILAAALQDYDRAVIVGASTTFGKGTVQRFYNLDKAVDGKSSLKPLGSVKVTTQKYFRINGESVQLRGVTPDIVLPDRYNYVDIGEKDYDHAMEWSTIDPVDFDQDVFEVKELESLRDLSASRVASNESFTLIEKGAALLKDIRENSKVPLSWDGYHRFKSKQDQLKEEINGLEDKPTGLKSSLLDMDVEYVQSDSTRSERYDKFLNGIRDDIYIAEAFDILQDLSELQQ